MKYMTPELYAGLQFASVEEAQALDDEWESNGAKYRAFLAAIGDRLPASVREFLDRAGLHDAELRGFETDPASGTAAAVAVLNLRLRNRLYTLYYDLLEPPVRTAVEVGLTPEQHRKVWATAETPEWLYDEFDVLGDPADPSGFVHEILLSTGEILRLAFFGFDWHVHDLDAAFAGMPTRR
ncbi:MAG TPA: hypothetical protein VF170_09080 [Planctomycetaceae bacterium]